VKEDGKFALLHCSRDYGAFVVAALESGKESGRILACTDEVSASDLAKGIADGM